MSTRTWQLVLRTATTLVTLDVFAQAMFAGRFMAGSYDALDAHAVNAAVLFVGVVLLTLCFAAAWRFAGTPGRFVGIGAVIAVITGLQIMFGYRMALAVHIPLGVVIVAGLLNLTVRSWNLVEASVEPTAAEQIAAEPTVEAGR
ncbi:hypothetical protein GPX89_11415 [Nocardia sp. ET3-3]|uniref:Integral membrane protein n=1 Tax=Nocardia terrae TaxID=2675851 RepID=A0A7K1UU90_9NOCA|nr:hypothetical protein [Nocardia terrae]MVU77851.1 hypothetical protein [Nocardia terrae]